MSEMNDFITNVCTDLEKAGVQGIHAGEIAKLTFHSTQIFYYTYNQFENRSQFTPDIRRAREFGTRAT